MITTMEQETSRKSALVVDMEEALDSMRHIEQAELWYDIIKHLSAQQRSVLHEELSRAEMRYDRA